MAARLVSAGRIDSDTGEPVWTSASYASVGEALLQAAHNVALGIAGEQRVEEDGRVVHDAASIAAAAEKLERARATNGFGARDGFDAAAELEAVS